jgi:hypothetical protein
LDAIFDPPLFLDQRVTEITTAMTEIDNERSILDSKRLFEMDGKIDKVKSDLALVKESMKEMKASINSK